MERGIQRVFGPWRARVLLRTAAVVFVVLLSGTSWQLHSSTPVHASGNVLPYYWLPWENGYNHQVTQGNGGSYSHTGFDYYAWDFAGDGMSFKVFSARAGKVIAAYDSYGPGGCTADPNTANYVVIRSTETDGTYHDALYLHLLQGSVTARQLGIGSWYDKGTWIGNAGMSGEACGIHLHFMVMAPPCTAVWYCQSVPASFQDGTVLYQDSDGVPTVNQWFWSVGAQGYGCPSGTAQPRLDLKSIPVVTPAGYTTYLDFEVWQFVSGGYWCWQTDVFVQDSSTFTMTAMNASYWCGTGPRHTQFASGPTATYYYAMSSGLVYPCTQPSHADDADGAFGTRIQIYGQTFDYFTSPSTYVHYY